MVSQDEVPMLNPNVDLAVGDDASSSKDRKRRSHDEKRGGDEEEKKKLDDRKDGKNSLEDDENDDDDDDDDQSKAKRRRGKEPDDKKKAKEKAKGKAKAKAKTNAKAQQRRKAKKDDDDDEEEGEEDEATNEEEEGEKKRLNGKQAVVEQKQWKDQSKNRKFMSIFNSLPGDVQEHFEGLSTAERAFFVNNGVQRQAGKLIINTQAMYQMMIKKEEKMKGRQKMVGFILEVPRSLPSPHLPATIQPLP